MNNPAGIEGMVRDAIRRLIPYASARDEFTGSARIFLDANENPYGEPYNRYPDPRQRELKARIAELKGQSEQALFLGNGSDEGIDLLFRVFCEPGADEAVIVEPTYGMYRVCADINNVPCRQVLLDTDFSLNAARVLNAVTERTKLIFLCSPNNPTSNSFSRDALQEILRKTACMVVADEAYIDFSAQPGLLPMVPDQANLVVLQTLSKAWGLAGIRLGMVFGHPQVIRYLTAVKYPYNVNALTLKAAIEALEQEDRMRERVQRILAGRDRLARELARLSFVERVHASDANFLLVRVEQPKSLYRYLSGRGIIVRDRSGVPLCQGCLRITIGTDQENNALMEALSTYNPDQP